jgi:hypothetical protein
MRTTQSRLSWTVTVEHFAHVDTASDEIGARYLDIGHDEIKSACRSWLGRCDSCAEVDRARRAWRRELYAPKRITDDEVGVEPPIQVAVKALGALDVRNRDDNHLELHVHRLLLGFGSDAAVLVVTFSASRCGCVSFRSRFMATDIWRLAANDLGR